MADIKMVCAACGSDDVFWAKIEGDAVWDVESQEFAEEFHGVDHSSFFCVPCDKNTDAKEVDIPSD